MVPRDRAWLNTVLQAWALRLPVQSGGSAASNTVALGRRIQELVADGVSAGWLDGAANGSDVVRDLGQRMQRRMRLHPSAWVQPAAESTGDVLRRTMWHEISARLPASVAGIAQRTLALAGPDAGGPSPASPQEALALAWTLHQLAVAAAAAPSTSDPASERLTAALTAQRRHLDDLGRQLRQPRPPASPTGASADVEANRGVRAVEDAIDLAEEMGRRPRRLSSWSSRGRGAEPGAVRRERGFSARR